MNIRIRRMTVVSVLALGLGLSPSWAAADPSDQPALACERAALIAARESGVPADILGTLALTETGRRRNGVVRPWAWSVNAEGAGSWFDSGGSALAFARDRLARGRPNMDVGCFQLNYRWHGENFASVEQMFDPLANARYAARFVRDLYAETGDWRRAAGAFHSRTDMHANRYLARFDELRAVFKRDGFNGMTGTPETYNRFALANGEDAAPAAVVDGASDLLGLIPEPSLTASAAPRAPREARTILGALPGTARTGRAGSLAVIGSSRGRLLDGARRPLIGTPPA